MSLLLQSVTASRDNMPSLMLEVRSEGKRREVDFVGFLHKLGQVGRSMSGKYSEFQSTDLLQRIVFHLL